MFKLLKNNVDELRAGIPHHKLSKTFQNAVAFARFIEIPYIWIDSLCIIQDSEEDWQKESALMNQVYTNALFNITANASNDGSGGLFRTRRPSGITPIYWSVGNDRKVQDLKFEAASGGTQVSDERLSSDATAENVKELPVGIWMVNEVPQIWPEEIFQRPLSKRAWAFQEFMLASRTIHFEAQQILFECNKHKACESHSLGLPEHYVYSAVYDIDTWRVKKPLCYYFTDVPAPTAYPTAHMNWYLLASSFNSLSLTFPSDKLPAISGIAQEFQNTIKSRYVAGMWRDHLLVQLLWGACGRDPRLVASYRIPGANMVVGIG